MLTGILIAIGLLLGIPLGLVALFLILPIRVGAGGFYRNDEYCVSGFARGWAGLCGAVCTFDAEGLRLRLVVGPWTIWQPKEGDAEEPELPQLLTTVSDAPQSTIRDSAVAPETEERDISRETPTAQAGVSKALPAVDDRPKPEAHPQADDAVAESLPDEEPPDVGDKDEDAPQRDEASDEEDAKLSWWWRLLNLHAQFTRYLDYAGDARPIVMRFLKRLLRIIRFRYMDLDVELGIGDPALMGRIFGYVEAFKRVVNKRVRIALTLNFVHMRIAGSGAFEISIYLNRLIWAVLCLASRGAIISAKVWWRERKVKRKSTLALDTEVA